MSRGEVGVLGDLSRTQLDIVSKLLNEILSILDSGLTVDSSSG